LTARGIAKKGKGGGQKGARSERPPVEQKTTKNVVSALTQFIWERDAGRLKPRDREKVKKKGTQNGDDR